MRRVVIAASLVLLGCSGSLEDDPGSPDAGSDAGFAQRARVVGTDNLGLRIRSAGSLDAEPVGLIPEGCLVDLLGAPVDDWVEIRYAGTRGFSHADFLEPVDAGADDCTLGGPLLLPWDYGAAFVVTNGHDTRTHTGMDHWAWDFGTPIGTPILAAHDGVVRRVKGDSSVGGCSQAFISDANYVVIDRGDGTESLYFHLASVSVSPGQRVRQGEVIGLSGETGWACGPHLHFQIQRGPDGGGTESGWNQSLPAAFYDTGAPVDPPQGAQPVSANRRPSG